MNRDIPGHILGLFLFFVTMFYAFAFQVSFAKNLDGSFRFDLQKGSRFAAIFMILHVWLLPLIFTVAYYLIFRASLIATLALGAISATVFLLVVQTSYLDSNVALALSIWAGATAAFAYQLAIVVLRWIV